MLLEVIITSVVIITLLITVYICLNRVSSGYDKRSSYYDLDCLYLSSTVSDIILNEKEDSFFSGYKVIDNIDGIKNSYSKYDVNVYYIEYKKEYINKLKELNNKSSFSDYIDYLNNSLDYDSEYSYIIISEMCEKEDKNKCNYYGLKVSKDKKEEVRNEKGE